MQIHYLSSSLEDLKWMRFYYESIFPQGYKNARERFKSIETLIVNNPYVGQTTKIGNVKKFSIPRTPFSFIYKIENDSILVLRIRDGRSGSSSE